MSQLVKIFIEPSQVYSELKNEPTFLKPLMIVMLPTAILTFCYFMKVDPTWYVDHTLMARADDMSPGDIARAKEMMPTARTMGIIGAPMAAIALTAITMVYALYFMLAGKLTGAPISFKHGMSLTCWSNMPVLLGALVGLAGVIFMTPQTSFESLMLTNLDPLIVELSTSSPWSSLATNFSLLNIWVTVLMAMGWRVWANSSWTQAAVVALIPFIVVYGAMAVWAMAKQ